MEAVIRQKRLRHERDKTLTMKGITNQMTMSLEILARDSVNQINLTSKSLWKKWCLNFSIKSRMSSIHPGHMEFHHELWTITTP